MIPQQKAEELSKRYCKPVHGTGDCEYEESLSSGIDKAIEILSNHNRTWKEMITCIKKINTDSNE